MDRNEYEHLQMQREMQGEGISQQQIPMMPQLQEQMQQQQAILVRQTNPREMIEEIMLKLEGRDRNPDGTSRVIGEPLLNKKGLRKIRFILHSHINDNVRLSRLKSNEISRRMQVLGDDLVDDLTLNFVNYEIRSKTDLDDINNAILCNIFDVLKRAEDQNEKNWLGKISVEQISGGIRMPPKTKGGFWDKFRI